MADEADTSNYSAPQGSNTDYSDHNESVLGNVAQHHDDGKYSNVKSGNQQIQFRGNMGTIGQARAKYNQNDTKAP